MNDLISRQSAIETLTVGAELLRRVLDNADIVGTERAKYEWGLGLIESYISDMKELPSARAKLDENDMPEQGDSAKFGVKTGETCTDCISRQAAIDALGDIHPLDYNAQAYKARIENLPSARRKGKWIYLNELDAFECSICGRQMVRNIFDYCPWCGAEMTKGEEDE